MDKLTMVQDLRGCRLVWIAEDYTQRQPPVKSFPGRVAMKREAPTIAKELGAKLHCLKLGGKIVEIESKP